MSASRSSAASLLAPAASRRSSCAESLPRPVSITSASIAGRCAAVTLSTSAPCAASVRPHTGPAITRVRSSTLTPASGRSPAGSGSRRRVADPLDAEQRQARDRAALRMRVPFRERARGGDDQAGLGGGVFQREGLPAVERALHRGAVVVGAQQLERAGAVVRQVGVQAHPAAIAAAVEADGLVAMLGGGLPSTRR